MSSNHLSSAPAEFPYLWRESVLSTRSLSYMSTADAVSNVGPRFSSPSRTASNNRNPREPTRRSTLTSESDYDLEMVESREADLKDIPELPHSVTHSPLFTLPREIRDRIYSFCLTSQNGWQVEWPTQWKAYALQAQLLRTCKIIYEEAAPLLYTLNTMTFHHPSDANMFVRAIASPVLSPHILSLSLHIKAQDTRLWMPYLTSKDPYRSLRADFPSLRELSIRFRSNKWQHSLPPESNMKIWCEDSRLDEVMDSLRHVYVLGAPRGPRNETEFETFISNRPSAFPLDPTDPAYRRQWLEIYNARTAFTAKRATTPKIKVVCACRVHATHYDALTTSSPRTPVPDLTHANNGTGVIQQQSDDAFIAPQPVQEGERFRGFTPVDLQAGMKKLHDPELGSAHVARTPFADKNGILISLEIHCLDPRRENPHAPV